MPHMGSNRVLEESPVPTHQDNLQVEQNNVQGVPETPKERAMIPFKPMKVETCSLEAYELFDDREWNGLLRRRGFDFTKRITYHKTLFGVVIKQWETPSTPIEATAL